MTRRPITDWRNPLTDSERDLLREIQGLAEKVQALATDLDKYPRNEIREAAMLIKWLCYGYANPEDEEWEQAIRKIRKSLSTAA